MRNTDLQIKSQKNPNQVNKKTSTTKYNRVKMQDP